MAAELIKMEQVYRISWVLLVVFTQFWVLTLTLLSPRSRPLVLSLLHISAFPHTTITTTVSSWKVSCKHMHDFGGGLGLLRADLTFIFIFLFTSSHSEWHP